MARNKIYSIANKFFYTSRSTAVPNGHYIHKEITGISATIQDLKVSLPYKTLGIIVGPNVYTAQIFNVH
jgi:hypothetical protein